MNLLLLVPAGLLGLVALLLPLLLHLARRSERRPTDFAALAWLTAHARPRRNLRFDEWPLLLVRLALVATLALLLARPALTGAPALLPWVVAVPGVAADALRRHPAPGDAQRRWLAPGWPTPDDPEPAGPQPVASLLRELDATLPAGTPLTVLVPPVIDGVDAQRPRLSRKVIWQAVDGTPAGPPPATRAAETRPRAAPVPMLVVRYRADRLPQVRYLRATALAWRASARTAPPKVGTADAALLQRAAGMGARDDAAPDIAVAGTPENPGPLPPRSAVLAWLVPGPVPAAVVAWASAGGTLLLDGGASLPPAAPLSPVSVAWSADDGRVRLGSQALGRGQVLQLTQPLLPPAFPELLEPDFPSRLRAALEPTPAAPRRADSRHYTPVTGGLPPRLQPRELAHWLAMLAAMLFVLERWLASGPRRPPAALSPAPAPA